MSIGSTIKHLRREKDITQEQLAEYLGITARAISQWECERTFPDIYMLPTIAAYFDVSIDYLFLSDKDEYEKEIKEYEAKYYDLWHKNKQLALLDVMKEAVSRYPSEYRLLVRYLNVIGWCASDPDYPLAMKNDAISIYERINSHCTVDSIRIWAKKIMVDYYQKLSSIENSGITLSDAEKIQSEMPLMQNTRDYMACFLHTDMKRHTSSQTAIAEMSYLMTNVIFGDYVYNPIYTLNERIYALETILKINDTLYENGGYGKNAVNMAYVMMRLGCFYHENGEKEKAQTLLHKSLALAKEIDAAKDSLVCEKGLLQGFSIEKERIPKLTATSLTETLENFIVQHKKIEIYT
ncbi:MAG: helix-turn-helix transcriptional regulator [Clostridia bacterium]|nr:helix-turn-helix transcriptional regulator [Clostridia bacterium]